MSDLIHIDRLRFSTIVGIHEWERHIPQDLVVSLWITLDLEAAARTDDLQSTLDYDALSQQLVRQVREARRGTIEAVAGDLIRLCLEDPRIEKVRVRVEKPGALAKAAAVATCKR